MKNNTPTISDPVPPLTWKLIMIGGGILIAVMLVVTVHSIVGVFRSAPPPPSAAQTHTEAIAVHSKPPAGAPLPSAAGNLAPLSAPDNAKSAASMASRPVPVDVQAEIMRQREKARVETIEALKREAQEQAGTSGVPKEVLQKLEQSDPIIY